MEQGEERDREMERDRERERFIVVLTCGTPGVGEDWSLSCRDECAVQHNNNRNNNGQTMSRKWE